MGRLVVLMIAKNVTTFYSFINGLGRKLGEIFTMGRVLNVHEFDVKRERV